MAGNLGFFLTVGVFFIINLVIQFFTGGLETALNQLFPMTM